jgi:selenide,water dikinase
MSEQIALTEFSHGAGCGCKIAPSVLQEILHTTNPMKAYASLLVGNESNDDAAVYLLNEEQALISTTDFFLPIVDDPFIFGQIAAANAISDVYAMGGSPLMAIAILGFPVKALPIDVAQQIIEGARKICAEANIPLAGGHSIDTKEPVFGLAVNGLVHPKNLKQNNKAQSGDLLFLTKKIGAGLISTAQKRKLLQPEHQQDWLQQLTQLNKIGEPLGKISGVHAMTDVTGFGLIGHLYEMASGSNLTAHLHYQKLPLLSAARHYLGLKTIPDGTYRNWISYSTQVQFEPGVDVMEAFNILPDPQTNGGLLIAVAPDVVEEVTAVLTKEGYADFTKPIGVMKPAAEKRIVVGV